MNATMLFLEAIALLSALVGFGLSIRMRNVSAAWWSLTASIWIAVAILNRIAHGA